MSGITTTTTNHPDNLFIISDSPSEQAPSLPVDPKQDAIGQVVTSVLGKHSRAEDSKKPQEQMTSSGKKLKIDAVQASPLTGETVPQIPCLVYDEELMRRLFSDHITCSPGQSIAPSSMACGSIGSSLPLEKEIPFFTFGMIPLSFKVLNWKHQDNRPPYTIPLPDLEDKVLALLNTESREIIMNVHSREARSGLHLSVVLVGPQGCGKKTLAYNVIERVQGANVYFFDAEEAAISEVSFTTIFQTIRTKVPGRNIFVINHIDILLKESKENLKLKKLLRDYELQIIGLSSRDERKSVPKQFASFIKTLNLPAMDERTTCDVLKEQFRPNIIDSAVLESSIPLIHHYFPERSNPGKSIEFFNHCLSVLGSENDELIVSQEFVLEMIAREKQLPLEKIKGTSANNLDYYNQKLADVIIGQENVIKLIARTIFKIKKGQHNKNKPPMVFVFAGPTGVGKTELAKKINELLYESQEHFLRIDMAEYKEPHSVSRLIGSPPGYVGYNEGGELTGFLTEHSSGVVLIDEVEKAHTSVVKFFLSVFDEGILTSAKGVKLNCKNVCFLMTTNLGANLSVGEKEEASEGLKHRAKAIEAIVTEHFGAEWLNRVTVIPFQPLTQQHAQKIVRLHLQKYAKEKKQDDHWDFAWTEDVVHYLARKGFDPALGARPLIKLIDTEVRDALVEADDVQNFQRGDSLLCSWTEKNGLQVERVS